MGSIKTLLIQQNRSGLSLFLSPRRYSLPLHTVSSPLLQSLANPTLQTLNPHQTLGEIIIKAWIGASWTEIFWVSSSSHLLSLLLSHVSPKFIFFLSQLSLKFYYNLVLGEEALSEFGVIFR